MTSHVMSVIISQLKQVTFKRRLKTLPVSGGSRVYIWGQCGSHNCSWGGGGTDLHCHSEPPLTSGKLCFIINFIGGTVGPEFLLGDAPPWPAL